MTPPRAGEPPRAGSEGAACYDPRLFFPVPAKTMPIEAAPLRRQLKDLEERLGVLRRYL